jgi:hypothetical protein
VYNKGTKGIKMTARLENWSVTYTNESLYDPPEVWDYRLQGKVYGHPNFPDGDFIVISVPLGWDEETKEVICLSRRYKLGKVNPAYNKQFPNARKRVIASLKKMGKKNA